MVEGDLDSLWPDGLVDCTPAKPDDLPAMRIVDLRAMNFGYGKFAYLREPLPSYCPGGFMEPHRDLQGTVMFPFQVMCPLSDPGEDYEGGRFFVQPGKRNVDRRHCQELFKGDVVVFRSGLYHGVEELTSGTRYAIAMQFALSHLTESPSKPRLTLGTVGGYSYEVAIGVHKVPKDMGREAGATKEGGGRSQTSGQKKLSAPFGKFEILYMDEEVACTILHMSEG
ncbi:unnamed protein product [Symbiodinium sp. CCMP2592]|nr:unnamed protein product [Symbiodinium sp. CCMP2592]